ncbi:hypothetical protein KUTeg_003950 [Tegillarca granosa]|uniref:REJ domain-containing protein n=1 Tax=Tegillarca granosa TaxID=220873 RepID=A0ABQ9FNH8_TEGGR|nr:hypothetical protein KUTeg_003950 [Tegillarca granosa]
MSPLHSCRELCDSMSFPSDLIDSGIIVCFILESCNKDFKLERLFEFWLYVTISHLSSLSSSLQPVLPLLAFSLGSSSSSVSQSLSSSASSSTSSSSLSSSSSSSLSSPSSSELKLQRKQ